MSSQTCKTEPFSAGDYSGPLICQLLCKYTPVGTVVSFSSDNPDSDPPIMIPPTTVTNSVSFVIGMKTTIPPGYTCNITYCWQLPGVPPPANMSISMQYLIPVEGGQYASM